MENLLKKVKADENPLVLIVTPLLPNHRISKETKKTIKRNKTPILWITSQGENNIPQNTQIGIEWCRNTGKLPPYFLMLDCDIILGRSMIDRLVKCLSNTPDEIAYSYASFEFKGSFDRKFPADPFDINRLVQHNYISSNSLIKMDKLDEVGGLVTDNKYKRLLDWALWLKFFHNGYYGMPCPNARFIAKSTDKDISAGSQQDYDEKRKRVLQDFVKPLVEKYSQQDVSSESTHP